MTLQKIIEYQPLNLLGNKIDIQLNIQLKIKTSLANYIIHKEILRHHTLKRQGTSSTKTRSQVSGGGRKPWKQKGTGRARAGSNRSPLWRGGGVTFGPQTNIKKFKLNKKERRIALQTLLYNKKTKILLIHGLEFIKPKTKIFSKLCNNWKIDIDKKTIVFVKNKTPNLKSAVQNIKNLELITLSQLNTLSLIKAKQLIISTAAFTNIKEIFNE